MENIYTDLALEMAENLNLRNNKDAETGEEIEGVEMNTEDEGDIIISTVRITSESGAEKMNKPMGSYITIESDSLRTNEIYVHERIIEILSEKLGALCAKFSRENTLVVGLGNSNVTPDSLGPKVIDKILITRHIMNTLPDELAGGVLSVCAIAPSVMGLTGIETAEIIRGLVAHVKPNLIIAIDALAARRISRINSVIQLTDTGISPGAGMGSGRMPLNQETLGVPVVAIGVPTVVDAATMINDTLDIMLASIEENMPKDLAGGEEFFKMLGDMGRQEKYQSIRQTLAPYDSNMFVTPKEIGEVINWLGNIIANGINVSLHPGLDQSDINRFTY